MTNQPRNRVVVFRLSQEEYRSLRQACDRRGARNLSDFTRTEVLSYLQSDALASHLGSRFAAIEQKVAALQADVNRVLQGTVYAEIKRQI